MPLLAVDAFATGTAAENRCPLPPAPSTSAAAAASASTAELLGDVQHITPSDILSIFADNFWLIVVCPHAASAFVTVACPCCYAFPNLLVIVARCATISASCLSSMTTGSGDATPAPNTPAENDDEDDKVRRLPPPRGRGASGAPSPPRIDLPVHPFCNPPPSLSSLMCKISLLLSNILNIPLEKDLTSPATVNTATISAKTIATIATGTNDVVSQQWQ